MRDDELYSSGIFASELDDDTDAGEDDRDIPDFDGDDDDDDGYDDDEDSGYNPLDDYRKDWEE